MSTKIFWIPSHCGIVGNELVDIIVKNACNYASYTNMSYFTDSLSLIVASVIEKMNDFINSYGNSNKGRKYIELNRGFSRSSWFNRLKHSRRVICLLNRIKSGHTKSRSHLFSKNILSNDDCDCGFGPQYLNHLIWECPLLDNPREDLLSFLRENKVNIGEDICYLAVCDFTYCRILHSKWFRFMNFIVTF